MPIEIRELIIKTTVRDDKEKTTPANGGTQAPREELVAACVEKVMDLLKQKMER